MATHKSAIKKGAQDERRRLRNRMHRSRLRSQIKRIRQVIQQGDAEAARAMLPATLSLLDRTARLGVIHRNAAARTKSRISRVVERIPTGG